MGDGSQPRADPFTRARLDALIDHLRTRSVRMRPATIIDALTDAGIGADAAAVLADAVLARMQDRIAPADEPVRRVLGSKPPSGSGTGKLRAQKGSVP